MKVVISVRLVHQHAINAWILIICWMIMINVGLLLTMLLLVMFVSILHWVYIMVAMDVG